VRGLWIVRVSDDASYRLLNRIRTDCGTLLAVWERPRLAKSHPLDGGGPPMRPLHVGGHKGRIAKCGLK
jgi:hypothetical protein